MMGISWGLKKDSLRAPMRSNGGSIGVTGATGTSSSSGIRKKRGYSEVGRDEKRRRQAIVHGQALPVHRSLEMMSKEQLGAVLLEMLKQHPEASVTFQSKVNGYQFGFEKYQQLLKEKVEALYASVPYNRSYDNNNLDDYAFVRMRPHIMELLNCLVDCALDNLPPRKASLHESLKFLDSCTQLVLDLPRFELGSNNYYYDKCVEQLAHLWCSLIEEIAKDINMVMNTPLTTWIDKLESYNDRSRGLLQQPLTLFRSLASDGDLFAEEERSSNSLVPSSLLLDMNAGNNN
ncbi:Tethering factor for nuclear proteasome STS1 [Nakaseomyces bracarensis]|uniref:Tethering factor for nuclear proteasome STS1 n=1 Tax=Nakaseomyces bracarensis TaxID=273131 RepID=A0ABR4NXL5_9SACH